MDDSDSDGPTNEQVAAACKEGHPVTKVTMVVWTTRVGLSGGEAESGQQRAGAVGKQTWRPGGPKKDVLLFRL